MKNSIENKDIAIVRKNLHLFYVFIKKGSCTSPKKLRRDRQKHEITTCVNRQIARGGCMHAVFVAA